MYPNEKSYANITELPCRGHAKPTLGEEGQQIQGGNSIPELLTVYIGIDGIPIWQNQKSF
jgi:hypothetical protein